jgi:hypothetical protein
VQNGEEWKIWLLCTIAEDIIGHEFVDLRKTNKTDNQVTKADEDLEEIDLDVCKSLCPTSRHFPIPVDSNRGRRSKVALF